jgi:hypothetical protein
MSKIDEIKNQLAQRLEKQAIEAQQPPRQTAKKRLGIISKPKAAKVLQIPTTSLNASGKGREGVVKLSVSLYDFDISCLEKIKDFMRERGIRRVSDSEALRIACRAINCDSTVMGIYAEMQGEDRRRRKIAIS